MKALVCASLLGVVATFSIASKTQAQGADVFVDSTACGMFDGNQVPVITLENQAVITNNKQGNEKLTCYATVTPSVTGRAVIWDNANTGAQCLTLGGQITSSWHEVVSASGEATLQCHINPGNP